MKYEDLPESKLVGKACLPATLFMLLAEASGNHTSVFTHVDRALGGPKSCRLLFKEPVSLYTETIALGSPLNCAAATAELMRLASTEARYDSPPNKNSQHQPGWEVRTAEAEGKKFVIVLAEWVLPTEDREWMIKTVREFAH